MNAIVMNMGVQMSLRHILFHSDIYPVVGLLDCTVVLILIFLGISILFSIMAVKTYISTTSEQGDLIFSGRYTVREIEYFQIPEYSRYRLELPL